MEKTEKLFDKNKRGGRRRRDILGYMASKPGQTAYQIAGAHYASGLTGSSITTKYLTEFLNLGLVRTEKRKKKKRSRNIYFLTPKGEGVSYSLGITPPSSRAEEIIQGMNNYSMTPLENGDVRKLRVLLTEKVVETLIEIYENKDRWQDKLADHFGKRFKAKLSLAMEEGYKVSEKKYGPPEKPNLAGYFISALAFYRWEEYLREKLNRMDDQIRRMPAEKRKSAKESPIYYIGRDFWDITCALPIIHHRGVAREFAELFNWMFSKEGGYIPTKTKASWLVVKYIDLWKDVYIGNLSQYGEMRSIIARSKKPRSRKERKKKKEGRR